MIIFQQTQQNITTSIIPGHCWKFFVFSYPRSDPQPLLKRPPLIKTTFDISLGRSLNRGLTVYALYILKGISRLVLTPKLVHPNTNCDWAFNVNALNISKDPSSLSFGQVVIRKPHFWTVKISMKHFKFWLLKCSEQMVS